jgi:hypothetical protein
MLACKLTGLLNNKEIYMSQVKKQYRDWCEKQDKQPEDFGDADWAKEFEQWLDDFAIKARGTHDEEN